ncbi:hypothetical protein Dda_3950 [Drechslerella dactyloides]|uniref:Uncharacterized protein n=1 Tax=Drechslerella dactyloides TaxID=74499 RepID=A0AAD6NIZ4_DREDA|nr:hypothetical protein Dda_3950 [Drechslerella dactyloides]
MPKERRQTRLADPQLSYKSVRYGNTPNTPQPFSRQDQGTLSQFGFTPSSLSATTSGTKKRRTLIPYGSRNRKSWPPDNCKAESPDESEDGTPATKRRRISRRRNIVDDNEENEPDVPVKAEDVQEDSFVKEESEQDDDEESWRPPESPAPKRRRRRTISKPKARTSAARNRTLTQMYPVYGVSESEYEEGPEEEQDPTEADHEEPEPERIQAPEAEVEGNVRIKNEPESDSETSHEYDRDIHIKREDEPDPMYQHAEDEKENIPREDAVEPTTVAVSNSNAAGTANPKTPKKPIPNVVPSSYTPPVTPLSPLRHSQLDAIYKSPSVQRLWRMKGIGMPGKVEANLSPVAEHIKMEEDDISSLEASTSENNHPQVPPKRPDFGRETNSVDAPSGATSRITAQMPDFIQNKMVPSSQWWEREETMSSNSARVLETIIEADSQPEVQVRSSVSASRTGTPTPKAQRTVELEELDIVPESPVRKRITKIGEKQKTSPTGLTNMEPLLRDSSGLHTLATSFLQKESSTIDRIPNSIQEESQKSEVSLRSVDKQLLLESEDYDKASAERVEETESQKQDIDPDETLDSTLSETSPKAAERTPRPVHRTTSLMSRKDSHIPLLPPSSPPHSHSLAAHDSSSPMNIRSLFPSSPAKLSTSPVTGFRKSSSDMNETMDSLDYPRKGLVETHTQWKLRTFGPSQAIPTISQILPASMLEDDDDDDDDDDEEL